jgi:hypothetical protein
MQLRPPLTLIFFLLQSIQETSRCMKEFLLKGKIIIIIITTTTTVTTCDQNASVRLYT